MTFEAFTRSGYELLQDGAEELARIEANGIRVDVPLLAKTQSDVKEILRALGEDLKTDKLWRELKRKFGSKASLEAKDQIRFLVYDVLGCKVKKRTEKGLPSVDDMALQDVDHPWIKKLTKWNRYVKIKGTFLKGISWELVGDRIHPFFHLDTVRTFRSSSSEPNFQNFPVRDEEGARLIRSLFIASRGCVLGENDFKGVEVGVSACYHKDPVFIEYLSHGDMHRDMAAQIYKLEEFLKDWSWPSAKHIRYGAKNKFVFPQFYGDWYVACAKNCWEWIDKGALVTPDGTDLKEWLKAHGIRKRGACNPDEKPVRGTFEWHMKEVEHDFWYNRFKVYGQWRKDFYSDYLDNGYFDILSGFRVRGVYSKNQVTNAPVQGAAFHCLLWSLIQINRSLRKYRMKTMLIGQIHDSLLSDIHEPELKDYLDIVEETVLVKLPKHFDWLRIIPKGLEVEFELCAPGQPWFNKKGFLFKDSQFKHPTKDTWTRDPALFLKAFQQFATTK